jgi:hypothetical protein
VTLQNCPECGCTQPAPSQTVGLCLTCGHPLNTIDVQEVEMRHETDWSSAFADPYTAVDIVL